MRMLALTLTVMAATLLMAPASPQDRVNPSRKDKTEESAKKVKELQKERIATLEERAAIITKLFFQAGRASVEEVYEATELVFKAKLDAAEKESDRITLYKNFVNVSRQIEKFADERMKFAAGTKASVLKIKAMRLKAEIDLLKAGGELPKLDEPTKEGPEKKLTGERLGKPMKVK
jgi:hypothetical protein